MLLWLMSMWTLVSTEWTVDRVQSGAVLASSLEQPVSSRVHSSADEVKSVSLISMTAIDLIKHLTRVQHLNIPAAVKLPCVMCMCSSFSYRNITRNNAPISTYSAVDCKSRDWMRTVSVKWPTLCRLGLNTSTQSLKSVNQSTNQLICIFLVSHKMRHSLDEVQAV